MVANWLAFCRRRRTNEIQARETKVIQSVFGKGTELNGYITLSAAVGKATKLGGQEHIRSPFKVFGGQNDPRASGFAGWSTIGDLSSPY